MANPIGKWLVRRYALLWQKYQNTTFDFEQARGLLKDRKDVLSKALNELRQAGWLDVSLDPKNARKRLYGLREPLKVVQDVK